MNFLKEMKILMYGKFNQDHVYELFESPKMNHDDRSELLHISEIRDSHNNQFINENEYNRILHNSLSNEPNIRKQQLKDIEKKSEFLKCLPKNWREEIQKERNEKFIPALANLHETGIPYEFYEIKVDEDIDSLLVELNKEVEIGYQYKKLNNHTIAKVIVPHHNINYKKIIEFNIDNFEKKLKTSIGSKKYLKILEKFPKFLQGNKIELLINKIKDEKFEELLNETNFSRSGLISLY